MKRIAILCSGQGMQYPAMFDELKQYPKAQALMQHAQELQLLSPPVADWLNGHQVDCSFIYDNRYAQELIVLYQLMLWEQIKEQLPGPFFFAGYSLGEVTAYGCAGHFSAAETLVLAQQRAELMSSDCSKPCGMAAIKGLAKETVQALCTGKAAYIAIENPGHHLIISGLKQGVDNVIEESKKAGAEKVVQLNVTVPSHCPLLESAACEFRRKLTAVTYRRSSDFVLAGINGRRVFNKNQALDALSSQISQQIKWKQCIMAMQEYGCETFIELGPGHALARMVEEAIPGSKSRALCEFRNINEVAGWIS